AAGPRPRCGWAHIAEWPGIAPPLDTPGVLKPRASPVHGTPLLGVGPGLEVSRGHLLQDTIVEREIGHQALQSRILLFQALQPFGLIDSQPAIFFLPPIGGLFRDPQLTTDLRDPEPFAGFNLNRPQMTDDLLSRVPFSCHAPSVRRSKS